MPAPSGVSSGLSVLNNTAATARLSRSTNRETADAGDVRGVDMGAPSLCKVIGPEVAAAAEEGRSFFSATQGWAAAAFSTCCDGVIGILLVVWD